MRSKILFKCGISLIFISLAEILLIAIMLDGPFFIYCIPLVQILIGLFFAIMGAKKVIITDNGIKLLERTILYKDIISVIVDYPYMNIKINQFKKNRWIIDFNLDIIKKIEQNLENKIKFINKIDDDRVLQQYFDEFKLKKEDIYSAFKDDKNIYMVLNNGKVLKFKQGKNL